MKEDALMLNKKKSTGRLLLMVLACSLVFWLPVIPAFAAATPDVQGVVTTAFGTYMKPQIKGIANNVVLPLLDGLILIAAIVTAIWSWHGYKREGAFKWEYLAAEGGGLLISLTAPLWMWKAIGWG